MFGFDDLNRPLWDNYFLTLAFVVSQRSVDQSTKHGTIVVSEDKTILSVGYNSPARGRNDAKVPQTRPEKYNHFLHSESAAIINAARHGMSLKGSTFYVTGQPCEKCTSEIINVGAKKVVYSHVWSHQIDESKQSIIKEILEGQDIEFIEFNDSDSLLLILENTKKYIKSKLKQDF